MFPDQQNQNGGQPYQQPQQPTYQPAPQPQYGVNSAPVADANGQYSVVPPPSVTGHPTGHNPYEFIVNPNTPKASRNLFGGTSFVRQIALMVGGVVLLMVIVAVALSLFGPKTPTGDLESIAETQQEIVRVATAGEDNAVSADAKDFVTNVALTVQSNQTEVINYLTSHGKKLSDKQLALKQNNQTDTLLSNAQTANTYDSTIEKTLASELTDYAGELQAAYKLSSHPDQKQIMQNCFTTAQLLVQQEQKLQ